MNNLQKATCKDAGLDFYIDSSRVQPEYIKDGYAEVFCPWCKREEDKRWRHIIKVKRD